MSVGQSRQQYRGCQTPGPISPLGNNNPAFAWHDNGREILFNNQTQGEVCVYSSARVRLIKQISFEQHTTKMLFPWNMR
eukprot:scaffold78008_cov66-Cyclotella_meneghiniana.AAC.1